VVAGVIAPSSGELQQIAPQYGFELDAEQAAFFGALIEQTLSSYRRVAELPEPTPEVRYPRTPGHRPAPAENPLNAWYWRCSVKGAPGGKLSGKRIAVKDPVAVAGVPMMAGSAVLEGFVPDIDATIVTRMLDAGAEIVGKTTCEDLSISGGSITSVPAPVRNPHRPDCAAGGSSSGSAAVVAARDCDMAIGADQGGSIRIPAALCGVVGLKPTYGLVPYTGILPIENSLDHVGPICRTVADAALLLEVIAGPDPLDPRQGWFESRYRAGQDLRPEAYTRHLSDTLGGVKIGILQEGFAWESACEATDAVVRGAAADLARRGAVVREVSVPMHRDGAAIYTPILLEGAAVQMLRGHGFGTGYKGYYPTAAMTFLGRSQRARGHSYSELVKLIALCGHYTYDRYQGQFYARAQNQMRMLAAAYDAALAEVDVMVMPTVAPEGKAMKMTADCTPEQYIAETFRYHLNCCPFDGTGHPALSVPCGRVDRLPVGMMIVGRHGDERTLFRVGMALEALGLYA
jgi:amidase